MPTVHFVTVKGTSLSSLRPSLSSAILRIVHSWVGSKVKKILSHWPLCMSTVDRIKVKPHQQKSQLPILASLNKTSLSKKDIVVWKSVCPLPQKQWRIFPQVSGPQKLPQERCNESYKTSQKNPEHLTCMCFFFYFNNNNTETGHKWWPWHVGWQK